jgi:hypothetical protein
MGKNIFIFYIVGSSSLPLALSKIEITCQARVLTPVILPAQEGKVRRISVQSLLTPVIPPAQEGKVRRISVQSQPQANSS